MIARIAPTLVLAVAIGVTAWLFWPTTQPLPEVRFNLLDGRKLDSAELRGRPVLVNFWSITCAVCLRDMPRLTRLQETLEDRGLVVIGVAMPHDPPPAVMSTVEQHKPGYRIALDVHGDVSRAFGDIKATPTTFLIDPAGNIRYTETGPLDETRVRATLLTF